MKKLPWSSMTSGLDRNFFLLLSCAAMLAAIIRSRITENKYLRGMRRPSGFIESSSGSVRLRLSERTLESPRKMQTVGWVGLATRGELQEVLQKPLLRGGVGRADLIM